MVTDAQEADCDCDAVGERTSHRRARVELELTVEAVRHRVPATVVETPFFSPRRKTANVEGL